MSKDTNPKGYLCLVLHGHLPYVVSHGSWPHGTDWLCEAAAESYLPLARVLWRLVEQGFSPKISIGLTPVLVEQLRSADFAAEFRHYLAHKQESAHADMRDFRRQGDERAARLAEGWGAFYQQAAEEFSSRWQDDLVGAFRSLQDLGHIEVLTSSATHAYLPLIGLDECVQAQVRTGVESYRRQFGRDPRGFWLPECGYRPRYRWGPPFPQTGLAPSLRKGVDEFLGEQGLHYFIVDSHLLEGGEALGVYRERFEALARLWRVFSAQQRVREKVEGTTAYEAYLVESSGEGKAPLAFFVRDPRTGLQVWSREHGYPGDGWYLEFHKKRFPGGHRYWRVTSSQADLGAKELYEPERVQARVEENADHFVSLVHDLLLRHWDEAGIPGVVCAPYDAELLGHWWFEGPEWLAAVVRKMAASEQVAMVTCDEYLENVPAARLFALPEGSWGEGGFHWVWLNEWTEWTWRHLYECEVKARRLAQALGERQGEARRVVEQCLRELLLLESSDWQFLITTWSARDYAESRFSEHLEAFNRLAGLAEQALGGKALSGPEREQLELYEQRDAPFAQVDPTWYARVAFPATGARTG